MNCANALIMITLGAAMLAAPHVAADWFPRTGIDGSSTRALWMGVVGAAQCGLALVWLARGSVARAWERVQTALPAARPAPAVADAETLPLPAFARPAIAASPAGSVTLNGEYAELWQAFHTALSSNGPAAQLAEQAVALARQEPWSTAAEAPEKMLTFAWAQDNERSLAA